MRATHNNTSNNNIDYEEEDDDDEEEGDDDRELAADELEPIPSLSVVIPDAGKIRFAEDIVEESRGGARGNRNKGRRSSGAGARGARRR